MQNTKSPTDILLPSFCVYVYRWKIQWKTSLCSKIGVNYSSKYLFSRQRSANVYLIFEWRESPPDDSTFWRRTLLTLPSENDSMCWNDLITLWLICKCILDWFKCGRGTFLTTVSIHREGVTLWLHRTGPVNVWKHIKFLHHFVMIRSEQS